MPGQVEVHDKETDILYIIEGQATIVTGGTMVGGRQTAPDSTGARMFRAVRRAAFRKAT